MREDFTPVGGLGTLNIDQSQLLLGLHKLALEFRVGKLGLVQGGLQALEIGGQVAVFGLEPIIRGEQRPGNFTQFFSLIQTL